jgi:hypothetical protein
LVAFHVADSTFLQTTKDAIAMIITANISFNPVLVKTTSIGPLITKVLTQFTDADVQTHPHAMGINAAAAPKRRLRSIAALFALAR